jgi:ribosomal protein L32
MTAVPAMTVCPNCKHEVPFGHFCVRCGESLSSDLQAAAGRRTRRGYAAAPEEARFAPRIISTLFPHLPRADMDSFRISLGIGVVAVGVLALLRLFPLALVGAAVLVPLLVILYLWDVDLYEDEPLNVLGLTLAWGIATGIGVGFLSKAVVQSDVSFALETTGHTLLWRGFLIPLISVTCMLAGPLVLLPYRKFNDVLDGATFGASCAVAFVGAELITHSATFLGSGIRPLGLVTPWVLRLLALAVLAPVISAGAIGGAAGALWLRFRAPVNDRNALGPLGHPVFAVALAAGMVVGAALIQLYTDRWWQLALLAVLALIALTWLRHVIHTGLLEEASKIPIGPPITCPNCGRQTPRHTFCSSCGISLQALPKSLRPRRPQATTAEGAA